MPFVRNVRVGAGFAGAHSSTPLPDTSSVLVLAQQQPYAAPDELRLFALLTSIGTPLDVTS